MFLYQAEKMETLPQRVSVSRRKKEKKASLGRGVCPISRLERASCLGCLGPEVLHQSNLGGQTDPEPADPVLVLPPPSESSSGARGSPRGSPLLAGAEVKGQRSSGWPGLLGGDVPQGFCWAPKPDPSGGL